MGIFSIKDIEAVSGIKSHTLRIWETRYGVLKPKRTDSNIRYYDDDDLKYVLNVSILNKHGFKISTIAKMDREDLCSHVLRINQRDVLNDNHIKNMITAMISLNENDFHQALSTSILQLGFEHTMIHVVFPFLNEVGILWQIGSIKPMHEHFATNIIKQKLFVAIDGNMGKLAPQRKSFVLFLPENERHSLGLLFANYMLRARGQEVIYLGQEVPLSDVASNSSAYRPDFVFTLLTCATTNLDKETFVRQLSEIWPSAKLLITGIQFLNADFEFPQNVHLLRNIQSFIDFVNEVSNTRID